MARIATFAVTTAAVLVLASGVRAAGWQAQTTATTPKVIDQTKTDDKMKQDLNEDEHFLKHVSHASKTEIAAAKLAVTSASNPEVKAYAEKLLKEHTDANADLLAMVQTKHVMITDDDPDLKTMLTKHESLQKLSGPAFDKEYLEDMISDHTATLARFTDETKRGKDPAVKAWAEKTLPALQEHLKAARDLHTKLFKK